MRPKSGSKTPSTQNQQSPGIIRQHIVSIVAVIISAWSLINSYQTRILSENASRAMVIADRLELLHLPGNPVPWLQMNIINIGKAPAKQIDVRWGWSIEGKKTDVIQHFLDNPSSLHTLRPEDRLTTYVREWKPAPEELAILRAGMATLFVYGLISYNDPITSKRFDERVCYQRREPTPDYWFEESNNNSAGQFQVCD